MAVSLSFAAGLLNDIWRSLMQWCPKGLKDVLRNFLVHGRHFEQIFQCRLFNAFDAAEGAQQRALARASDSGNVVQNRIERFLRAQFLVVGNRETMGLVP